MTKDPAFLFYSQDFIVGTMTMTNEQVGKYIKLLCMQHQNGHLPEEDMIDICEGKEPKIWRKFKKDENGLYYNERLEQEAIKRKEYSESRRRNRKSTHDKDMKTYDTHMENENVNENIIKKKRGCGGKKEKSEFNEFIQLFNSITRRNFHGDKKARSQFNARIKDGCKLDDFKKAIKNCYNDPFHKENPNYLTPEFITRADKLEKYMNYIKPEQKTVEGVSMNVL